MKRRISIIGALLFFLSISVFSQKSIPQHDVSFVREQIMLDYNAVSTWVQNTGTFNQDIRTNNTPGFMFPRGSHRFAIFTTGMSIGAFINGRLRLATASWESEFQPGIIININGVPTPYTDNTFKLYKVSEEDNCQTNPDWANWGLMVPYGAPYTDVNGNLQYDPCIDTPGIHGAGQTIFICLTDGFPENHSQSTGFSGGTKPMNSEVRLTAWSFGGKVAPVLTNDQYFRWQIINKNDTAWNKTRFSIVCDPDIGDGTDDYIGCDTVRQMAYAYNSDNVDGIGTPPSYGQNPPAVGMRLLRSVKNKKSLGAEIYGCSSFCYFTSPGASGSVCESDPDQPSEAYNYMNSLKADGSPWINPLTLQQTKFTYSGNPDGSGWTEFTGRINNCGSDSGALVPSPAGDRRFVITTGKDNLTLEPGDTMDVIMTQIIAKGANNLNAVTKLFLYSDAAKQLFDYLYIDDNPALGIEPVVNPSIPSGFYLSDNYPNPFNPTTKINYGLPIDFKLEITVYDAMGNKVVKLFDGVQQAGNYTLEFNGSNLASGVYFLKMKSGAFIVTRKLMLLK